MNSLFLFDGEYRARYGSIAGLDEAGRGPLAGPLVAAAVILPPDFQHPHLNDSKKLTDRRRRELFPVIKKAALAYSTGVVTSSEIDANRMSWAVRTSFRRAMEPVSKRADVFLIDGNSVSGLEYPCLFIVKGDSKSLSIAAASVVAKVTRDDMMVEADGKYPGYGFRDHKGYGTAEHLNSLKSRGPTAIHRMSFEPLKSMYSTGQLTLFPLEPRNPGKAAELRAAEHYERMGYRVAARNWRCPAGEIDLIIEKEGSVVFVEVKSAFTGMESRALKRVNHRKISRISQAGAVWISENGFKGDCSLQCILVTPDSMEIFKIP